LKGSSIAVLHECAHEGCRTLTSGNYCPEHNQPTGESLETALAEAAASAANDARATDDP
jgi:hypothetical protein